MFCLKGSWNTLHQKEVYNHDLNKKFYHYYNSDNDDNYIVLHHSNEYQSTLHHLHHKRKNDKWKNTADLTRTV